MSNLIQITSVVADSIPEGKLQLVVRFKDTDKQPISAANRVRAIMLPANIWSDDDDVSKVKNNNLLSLFLHDAIEELAKSYLSTIIRDSNWMRLEVPEEHFFLSSLLEWQQEQSASTSRLNAEVIKAWVAGSYTIASIKEAHSEKHATALGEQFVKLAGPNHGLTPEKAEKILSNLWDNRDTDDNTGMRVMLRLQAIKNKKADGNLLEDLL